ncbi:hypothetical protein I302_104411 [Kwoniella bestiolae CBS 10118]|uniref:Integral membrane protein n=1 Tax=Kwoniella bestiolae CBS 10118 TaxID=1296100 RepID=A0A1B9GB62_9TREE|nr:hypothetical protein I302_03115 [Kwoniella bestiolae CBS 10118]OCF28263.1 hypothetical protein I302_03115 [Kwoniella bestiolae CBS 10118]
MFRPSSSPTTRLMCILLGTLGLVHSVKAKAKDDCDAIDPFLDPKNDPCNPFRYIPDKAGNIVVAEFFTHSAFFLLLCYIHRPIRWFLVLLIGAATHAIGLWFRLGIRALPHSLGFIIIEEILVVLSPCAYLAALYILLGRITQHLDGAKYLRPIKPEKVAKIFVWSDLITFLIQGNASGLLSNKNPTVVKAARYGILVGLILQFISFMFFCYLVVMFFYRVRKEAPQLYRLRRWKKLYFALIFTCVAMLVRSVYRIAEFAQDQPGYLYTHEIFFFTLDCLPMGLTISTYVIFWPGRYLTDDTKVTPSILDGVAVDNTVMLSSLGEDGRTRMESGSEEEGRARR